MEDISTLVRRGTPAEELHDLLDAQLPAYDVVLTEHLVVDATPRVVFSHARDIDFLGTAAPMVRALRMVPDRVLGRRAATLCTSFPSTVHDVTSGWTFLGEVPGREVVFGAVGTLWRTTVVWQDVPADQFAAFEEPGWAKIACHFLVRPDGPGRSVLTCECRTATTDGGSRARMSRSWLLTRPVVAHGLRVVLRTIRTNVEAHV